MTKDDPKRARFDRQVGRIIRMVKTGGPAFSIPMIARHECLMVLKYYHGGRWPMLWALFKETVLQAVSRAWILSAMWVSDRMGWTKVYFYPETETMIAYHQRHGRKCSGSPNCNNMNCIEDSLPGWFKKLTR